MGERTFTTLPIGALADTKLTALELRVLGIISMHDGMSELKGGAGCYASFANMASAIGTDLTNFSKCLSKLLGRGYLSRERLESDRRKSTLRVHFPTGITCSPDQPSADAGLCEGRQNVGEATNQPAEIVGGPTNQMVGEESLKSPANLPFSDPHYNLGLNSSEEGLLNSTEVARFASRDMHEDVLRPAIDHVVQIGHVAGSGRGSERQAQLAMADAVLSPEDLQAKVCDAIAALGTARKLSLRTGVSEANISRARNRRSISLGVTWQLMDALQQLLLPSDGNMRELLRIEQFVPSRQPPHVQLSRFERGMGRLDPADLDLAAEWLAELAEAYCGTPTGHHAQRLYEGLPCPPDPA